MGYGLLENRQMTSAPPMEFVYTTGTSHVWRISET